MRPKKIKDNVTDLNNLLTLYFQFKPVISQLGLSYECLNYYAQSVIKSRVHQVSRRDGDDRYLHLLAFIVYQTLKLQDLLIDTMLLAVQATTNATAKEHQERYYNKEGSERSLLTIWLMIYRKGF